MLNLPPRVEDGADPSGRDTFTLPPGCRVSLSIDGRPAELVEIPAGTYVGEVTAERVERERREAEEREADLRRRRDDPDPVCTGIGGVYSCGCRRSQLNPGETMNWSEVTESWWCSSCEASWDD